jgi:thioredoxin 1
MIIAKLNVDENHDLSAKYGVMSIPTVIVFKDGQEVDRQIGFPGEGGYRQLIDKNLGVDK